MRPSSARRRRPTSNQTAIGTSAITAAWIPVYSATSVISSRRRLCSACGCAAIAAYRCASSAPLSAVVLPTTTLTPMRPSDGIRMSGR